MVSCGFSQDYHAVCRARLRHHRNSRVKVALITRAADHPYHPPSLRDTHDNGTVATPKSAPHMRALMPSRNTQAAAALANTGVKNGAKKRLPPNHISQSRGVPPISIAIVHLAIVCFH